MDLFVVDQAKCTKCGACVVECPIRIIELLASNQLPTPIVGADDLCINCGHCVAVCPTEALALRTMAPGQCAPVRKEWRLDPERVEHLLRARRSIRSFKYREVDRELLVKLIDVARYAPTGSNRQPVNWLVVSGQAEVRRLAELTMDWIRSTRKQATQPTQAAQWRKLDHLVATWESGIDYICRGAPHVIVAHAPQGRRTDCIIALTYLELAAYSHGLGPCWAGWVDGAANNWAPMQEHLGLPPGHTSCGGMMIGYPDYVYHRVPLRNDARITWR